jgi:hypothetical protein
MKVIASIDACVSRRALDSGWHRPACLLWVNYDAGKRTPRASVYSSIFLVGIVLLVTRLASYRPVATIERRGA